MTLKEMQKQSRKYGISVKKVKSKWGMVYQIGFIGSKKEDSVRVSTLRDARDIIEYIVMRKTA